MSRARLWLVSPVYFDSESFSLLRERVVAVLADDPCWGRLPRRFVVVDDSASLDEGIHALAQLDDVTVVTPPFNLGHQRAIVYGLRSVLPDVGDTDFVVTLDSDGEDRPEDLPRLLEPLRGGGGPGSISLALRTSRREPLPFRLMYLFFKVLFQCLTGTSIRSGNFAAYPGSLARRMLQHPHFDLCYSSTLVSLDLPVTLVPCARGQRYAGRSRMGYTKLFIHGLRMLMPFTDRIAIRALVAFSLTLATALVFSLVVVAVRVFTAEAIPGWATYTLLLLFIVSFIALGNFVVLFAVFSQSRGLSLANLEDPRLGRPRETPDDAD